MQKDVPITLPVNDIRSIRLTPYHIRYSDGTVVQNDSSKEREITVLTYDRNNPEDVCRMNAVQTAFMNTGFCFQPMVTQYGWVCACGRLNPDSRFQCSCCGSNRSVVMTLRDEGTVNELLMRYEENLRVQPQQAQTRKKKLIDRASAIVIAAVAVIIIVVILLSNFSCSNTKNNTDNSSSYYQSSSSTGRYTS